MMAVVRVHLAVLIVFGFLAAPGAWAERVVAPTRVTVGEPDQAQPSDVAS